MTNLSSSITRLVEAHEALCPYFDTGRAHQAPSALIGEYAEAAQNAPTTYWAAVERLEPGTSTGFTEPLFDLQRQQKH